jgi:nucleoside-diphosphate-sugar epimerase
MKILLTGANGFIGHNYLDKTTKKSIHTISRRPLEHTSIFYNYIGDLTDQAFIKKVFKNRFDVIIHCAWQGLPDRTVANNKNNLNLNLNLIDLLSAYSNAKNIFIGSCLEYGDRTGILNEADNGTNINDFGKTKLDIYKNILAQSVEFIWLRPFYLYGKHQHPNALINHLYNKISTGQEIELKNPNQAHDFLYINDLISIIKIIEISKIKNEVFNVGSGTSVSVTEVANSIKSLFGKERVTNSILEDTAIADINKAKEMLKWSPKYSIETGIQEFVEEKKND